jgi:hypothetical protein
VFFVALAAGCSDSGDARDGESRFAHLPYAQELVDFSPGPGAGFNQTALPDVVLGPPQGKGVEAGSLDVLSLGRGGEIVLGFGARAIEDGPGPDFVVFENPFYAGGDPSQVFAEPGEVSVSEDGATFVAFPCDPTEGADPPFAGCAGVTPTLEFDPEENLPLDAELSGGDAFDLADAGLARARFVRVTDRSSAEPAGETAGFDLDAVGIVHASSD